MKKLIILIFVLFSQTGLAQDSPVSVLKQKWYEWNDYQLLRESPPFSAAQSQVPNLPGSSTSERPISGVRSQKFFVYETVIKNETDKKIIGLVWDYVIYAPTGKTEQERQTFVSTDPLKKQKKKTLTGRKLSPPGRVINAKDYEQKDLKPIEQVEIKCVLFEDKTTWKPEGTNEKTCERLRLSIQRKKR